MDNTKVATRLALAFLTITAPAAALANDDLTAACESELDDRRICECASKKLGRFLGKDKFKKYQAFFGVFVERHAQQTARDGDSLSAWNGAMSRYARQSGDEPFNVMTWVPNYESVHRYALMACGAVMPNEGREQSLLFFGAAR